MMRAVLAIALIALLLGASARAQLTMMNVGGGNLGGTASCAGVIATDGCPTPMLGLGI